MEASMSERERDRAEAWGDGWRAGWEAAWAQLEAESAVQVGSVSVSAGQARDRDIARAERAQHAARIALALGDVLGDAVSRTRCDWFAEVVLDAIEDKRWRL